MLEELPAQEVALAEEEKELQQVMGREPRAAETRASSTTAVLSPAVEGLAWLTRKKRKDGMSDLFASSDSGQGEESEVRYWSARSSLPRLLLRFPRLLLQQ